MSRQRLILSVLLAAAVCGLGLAAEAEKAEKKPLKVPVPVEEDVILMFADQPQAELIEAREAFLEKDLMASAEHLRLAAAFMRLEAFRASQGGEEPLLTAAYDLEELARKLERHEAVKIEELGSASALSQYALAKHRLAKAQQLWLDKQADRAGRELKAAVAHAESAAGWAGHEMAEGTATGLKDARTLAEKLMQGAGWTAEEVGKGLENAGNSLAEIGKSVPAHQKTKTAAK